MSVLIKGIEMPFTCLTCDFHKCAGGVGDFCSLTKRRQFRFKNRPKDCPLVPVPEHGDLIDRDAAAEKIWDDMRFPSNLANAQFFVNELREMPTVIPADEGE